MSKTPDPRFVPDEHRPARRLHSAFRRHLEARMFALRCDRIAEQIDRFEVLAPYLSPAEMRPLNIAAISQETGYAEHLLRGIAYTMVKKVGAMERNDDVEGTWWSLTVDPWSAPPEDIEAALMRALASSPEAFVEPDASPQGDAAMPETVIPGKEGESDIERLYRSCCDVVSDRCSGLANDLTVVLASVEDSQAQAMICDVIAGLQEVQSRLTRVCAAGVRQDPRHYLETLVSEWKERAGGRRT